MGLPPELPDLGPNLQGALVKEGSVPEIEAASVKRERDELLAEIDKHEKCTRGIHGDIRSYSAPLYQLAGRIKGKR